MRRLFHEHRFVLVVTQPGEVAVVGPIEELAAQIWAFAGITFAPVHTLRPAMPGGGMGGYGWYGLLSLPSIEMAKARKKLRSFFLSSVAIDWAAIRMGSFLVL